MTSQGPGAPFEIGEAIPAWRACEVHGGAWIGPDSDGQEVLTIAGDGNEALFRYVAFDRPPGHISFSGVGEGRIEVYLDDTAAPIAHCHLANGTVTVALKEKIAPGRYTLRLVFRLPRGLQLSALQFI